jgi:hypothetical protein
MPRALAAALLLLAAAAAPAASAEARDPGGSLALRMLEIRLLEVRGEPKRIRGECLSACTLYLGLSTACFDEDAVLGFHGPTLAFGLSMSDAQFEAITTAMASYYPPRVARLFLEDWRHSDRFVRIPAEELIDRGEARPCEG